MSRPVFYHDVQCRRRRVVSDEEVPNPNGNVVSEDEEREDDEAEEDHEEDEDDEEHDDDNDEDDEDGDEDHDIEEEGEQDVVRANGGPTWCNPPAGWHQLPSQMLFSLLNTLGYSTWSAGKKRIARRVWAKGYLRKLRVAKQNLRQAKDDYRRARWDMNRVTRTLDTLFPDV